MFLDALEERLGEADARRVFADLRRPNDVEAPVIVPGSFPHELPSQRRSGSVVSTTEASRERRSTHRPFASNALLVGAKRSETGHPLFVAGPQVGYFFPQFFAEMELAGAGFAMRGAVFPGVPFVLIGRGPDFAWSATSSQADNVDLFVETLCDDDRHYLYRGQCEPMRRFFVGTLKAQGAPDQPVSYYETTHGPVVGYATVAGKRVAISVQRSTRGREILELEGVLRAQHRPRDLGAGLPADDERGRVQLQLVLRGRPRHRVLLERALPLRAAGTDPALPTVGTGEYDWRGFLPVRRARARINPPSGRDPELEQQAGRGRRRGGLELRVRLGPPRRLLRARSPRGKKHSLATRHRRDEQGGDAGSARRTRLAGDPRRPPHRDPRRARARKLRRGSLDAGVRQVEPARPRSRRQDRRSGRGGARRRVARLADAVMTPVLGPLVGRLAALHGRSDDAGPDGSAYISGWYGYVEKDLRTLLGRQVRAPYSRRYCGAGVLATCREALWARARRGGCGAREPRRALRPRRGEPTRRGSESGSRQACSRTRCAGRIDPLSSS